MQKSLSKLGIIAAALAFAQAANAQIFDPYFQSLPSRPEPVAQTQVIQPTPQQQPVFIMQPQMQRPTTQPTMSAAPRNQSFANDLNSFYGSVNHTTRGGEFEIWQSFGSGSFMFHTAAESVLRWDEARTTTTNISFTRDFMLKHRQLVFNAQFGSGSFTTSRTSDDDVFNELHLMSLGKGRANLESYQASIGLRNAWRWAGFDITPLVGYKKKVQDMKMSDHFSPAPYFYFIGCDENDDCLDIDLNTSDFQIYSIDIRGNEVNISDPSLYKIPGAALYHGILIPAEDFCWWGGFVDPQYDDLLFCLDAEIGPADPYNNLRDSALIDVFGGMSQLVGHHGDSQQYKASWAGPFVGLNLERLLSPVETLNLYAEVFMPKYTADAIWPNRAEFAQPEIHGVPSFRNYGGSAIGYLLEAKYKYRINQQLGIFAGLSYEQLTARNADETLNFVDEFDNLEPTFFADEIRIARWRNTAWSIGLSYRF
ncbi:MAG: hypothetical protein FWD15_05270 [Alphaproteobacteria bacterium]|nr:hypothetical protein [Alphaproteobacteria bacterium]